MKSSCILMKTGLVRKCVLAVEAATTWNVEGTKPIRGQ